MMVEPARALFVVALLTTAACSSDSMSTTPSTDAGPSATGSPGTAQLPPTTSGTDVEAWLAGGAYKGWHCEAAPHASRSPSPHNMNRICSNDLTSGYAGTGERPEGSAGVKELYDATGTSIVGYAVYAKTEAASAGGANWYWYERVPLDSSAPHDAKGIVADGLGTGTTPANLVCVSCHSAAGSDTAHTPTPGSADEVYTQIK